jgi:hypothetical protein
VRPPETCTRCKKEQPASAFGAKLRSKLCLACNRQASKESRARRAAAEDAAIAAARAARVPGWWNLRKDRAGGRGGSSGGRVGGGGRGEGGGRGRGAVGAR